MQFRTPDKYWSMQMEMVITNIRVCPVPLYSAWGFSRHYCWDFNGWHQEFLFGQRFYILIKFMEVQMVNESWCLFTTVKCIKLFEQYSLTFWLEVLPVCISTSRKIWLRFVFLILRVDDLQDKGKFVFNTSLSTYSLSWIGWHFLFLQILKSVLKIDMNQLIRLRTATVIHQK